MQALIADGVLGHLHLAVHLDSRRFATVVETGGRPDLALIFRYRPYRALVDSKAT